MRYLIIFIAFLLNAKVLVVDDDANCVDTIVFHGCTTCENPLPLPNGYKTIKDAVKKANDGDIIKICKGTYNESIFFNKWASITFEGAKDVKSPSDVKWEGNFYSLLFKGKDLKMEKLSLIAKTSIMITNGDGNYNFKNLIVEATNGNGIYIKKGKDIEVSDVNITASESGIYIYKPYGNYNFSNINIKAYQQGIFIYQGKHLSFKNINIDSHYDGIDLINTYGEYTFSNIDINSKQKGIYINKGKNISFSDVNITSNGDSIDLIKPYGNYNFSSVNINSQNNGILITGGHNITISNSKVVASQVDLNISHCWGDYTLSDSKFRSTYSTALYFENTNHLNIQNCCIRIDSTNGYGLNFNGSNSDYWHKIDVSDNCFYGELSHLARAKNHNTINGNYWNCLSGVYDYNNITDNSPLANCPNSCWSVTCGGEAGYFNSVSQIFHNNSREDWENNLSTQIVNRNFNLWILSKDKNDNPASAEIKKVGLYLYSNGGCSGNYDKFQVICENNCPNTNANGEVQIQNISVDNAYKCSKVYIKGKVITSLTSNYKEANSSDEFAIRPKEFNVTISSKVTANRNFEVNVTLLDNNKNLIDYNGSLNLRIDLNASKNSCSSSDISYAKSLTFHSGKASLEVNYSNVADLNVTLKEGNPIFAEVDKNDGVSNNLEIDENKSYTKAIPKYFEVNATLRNFDNGFTYLDKKLNAYGILDINVTAKGEKNINLTNYSDSCYGSEVNLSFHLDYNQTPNLNKLITNEKEFSISELNTSLSHFVNGIGKKEIHFNYDKNYSNPIIPFEVNISSVQLIQKDVNSSNLNSDGNVTFYYGNLNLDDVITTNSEANNTATIIVYKIHKNREVKFNWFLNSDMTTNISNIKVMRGYRNSFSDEISGINVSVSKSGANFIFDISNIGDNKFFVIHILDSSLSTLWYSKFNNDYNVSEGSTCLNHFCFAVSVEVNQSTGEAGTGSFRGTETNVTIPKVIAPKIYR